MTLCVSAQRPFGAWNQRGGLVTGVLEPWDVLGPSASGPLADPCAPWSCCCPGWMSAPPLVALWLCGWGHRMGPVGYPELVRCFQVWLRNGEQRLERGPCAGSWRQIQGHPPADAVGSQAFRFRHPHAAPPDLVPLVAQQRTQVQTWGLSPAQHGGDQV